MFGLLGGGGGWALRMFRFIEGAGLQGCLGLLKGAGLQGRLGLLRGAVLQGCLGLLRGLCSKDVWVY